MTAQLREPSPGTPGTPGAPGPAGPPGPAGSAYTHIQDSPSSLWLIGHNLGMFPNVTTVDTLDREVEADVQYIDANNLTVAFAAPSTGKAFLS